MGWIWIGWLDWRGGQWVVWLFLLLVCLIFGGFCFGFDFDFDFDFIFWFFGSGGQWWRGGLGGGIVVLGLFGC